MSDYVKLVDYAAKDALLSGNPSKIVKGVEIGAEFDAVATAVATKWDATLVDSATSKTTPVDADELPLVDSAASNTLKKLTWANLKATLKTYFDSVTTTLTNKTLTSPVISGGTIDNAVIGGTTKAAGAFTTLSASSDLTVTGARATTVASSFGAAWASGSAELYSYGANASTNGNFSFVSRRSDGTNTVIPVTISTTGLSVTGALSATGAATIGAGGTGAINGSINIDGSSASGQGAVLNLKRNSVTVAQVGTRSYVVGGTSDDLVLNGGVGVGILIGGVSKAEVSSTGLAVSGTGSFTSTSGTILSAENTSVAAGDIGEARVIHGTTVARLTSYSQNHSIRANQVWLNTTSASSPVVVGVNSSAIGTFSSTGLAVSGTGSFSGGSAPSISVNGGAFTGPASGTGQIYSTASGGLILSGYGSGQDIALLDRSGNLRAAVSSTGLAVTGTGSFTGTGAWLSNTGAGTSNKYTSLANTVGVMYYGIESSAGASIISGTGAYSGVIAAANGLHLSGNGTAAQVNIDTSGNLLVGRTARQNSGRVEAKAATSENCFVAQVATDGNSLFQGFASAGGSATFQVVGNGNVTNTNNSYGAISDIKLKENIVDVPSYWDKYKQLKWRNFNLIADPDKRKQLGLVAQEAELIFPGVVDETPDRDQEGNDIGTTTKSVKYSIVGHIADTVLQEAQARIEELEAYKAQAENLISNMLQRLAALEAK